MRTNSAHVPNTELSTANDMPGKTIAVGANVTCSVLTFKKLHCAVLPKEDTLEAGNRVVHGTTPVAATRVTVRLNVTVTMSNTAEIWAVATIPAQDTCWGASVTAPQHMRHALAPLLGAYVDEGHAAHAVALEREKVPASQMPQVVALSLAKRPAEHTTGGEVVLAQKEPPGQRIHETLDMSAYQPSKQATGDVDVVGQA
jgi:hypothetical protein